ncbi:MAG: hypothetical protein WD627_04950 [Actinomycetota bacterium]
MTTACQQRPQAEQPDDPSFFGGATETAGVFVGSDTWIGWGRTSHADFDDVEVMTALGAKREGGKWRTTLLEPLAVCERSGFDPEEDVEESPELLSTGASLVANCEIGGTNGESAVGAVGVGTREIPTVVLAVTCGVTWFDLRGQTLELHRADLKPGSTASLTGEFTYQMTMPDGSSALRPINLDDWDRFDSECLPPRR